MATFSCLYNPGAINIHTWKKSQGIENNKATFSASVSKGTFIRSLVVDLASYLGTKAVVSSIVRTSIGNLNSKNSPIIDEIDTKTENDIPTPLVWTELFNLPIISVGDDLIEEISNGNFLSNKYFGEKKLSIIENKNTILAIYEPYNENKFKPQKVLIWKFTIIQNLIQI